MITIEKRIKEDVQQERSPGLYFAWDVSTKTSNYYYLLCYNIM